MGLFLCQTCERQWSMGHECDLKDLKSQAMSLRKDLSAAESRLYAMDDEIKKLLAEVDLAADSKFVVLDVGWLQRLAAAIPSDDAPRAWPPKFLSHSVATHFVLSAAISLFRRPRKESETFRSKLIELYDRCRQAREVLGYAGTTRDLMPEEVLDCMRKEQS